MVENESVSAVQTVCQKEPKYRFLFGGLWAFVVKGGWKSHPGESERCYPEVHVLGVNAACSNPSLCDHYPVLILRNELLSSAVAEPCDRAKKVAPASNREVLVPGLRGVFEAVVLPLRGLSVSFEADGPDCVCLPDYGRFSSVIDLNQPALGAGPVRPDWITGDPHPGSLVNSKLVLDQGILVCADQTIDEKDFENEPPTRRHTQKYCTRVTWELPASRLVIRAYDPARGVVEKLTLKNAGEVANPTIAISNFCEADHVRTDAVDVKAFYDLSEEPLAEEERLYPRIGKTGSSDDFCPPGRMES